MRLSRSLALLWVLIAAFAGAQTTQPTTPPLADSASLPAELKKEVLEQINKIMAETAFVPGVDFKKWPELLKANQEELDKATTPRDLVTALNKTLREFGTSHFVVSTPQAAQTRRTRRAVGIGIMIQPEEKGIRVTGIFPGSPAEQAGLKPGDLVTHGNGKEVKSPADLQGEEGQPVTLTVQRENKEIKVKVVRRTYSQVRPETLTWQDKDTAVLKVWTFDTGYNRENIEKLMKEAGKARRLVVDLRSNPGGAVLNLMHLMGLLAPPGTAVGAFIARGDVERYTRDGKGSPTDFEAIGKMARTQLKTVKNRNGVEPYTGKIAVLVNGASGSAAEIAAAALAESLNAPVIGSKSAGAVLASLIGPLPGGFALQYPIMDYVTPQGKRLEGTGVAPLLESAKIPKFGETDEALEKAVLLLQRLDRIVASG